MLKRLFDIIFALTAIAVLLIPWLIISWLIKIQSPGPVVFKARRVGLNGKIFTLYKFRSMNVNSGNIHLTTLRNDNRIFPLGAFLRKSKLDETLQFFNILFGEMSIIGPRPEDEVNATDMYKGEFRKILSVKPGLSSPASLYDYTHGETFETEEEYNEIFVPQKLKLEKYYIEHRNDMYDLQIIFRTALIIFLIVCGKEKFNPPRELAKFL